MVTDPIFELATHELPIYNLQMCTPKNFVALAATLMFFGCATNSVVAKDIGPLSEHLLKQKWYLVDPHRDMPLLHQAVIIGDVAFIDRWIESGNDVDIAYDDKRWNLHNGSASQIRGETALMITAQRDQIEIAEKLIRAGANLYAQSHHGSDLKHTKSAFGYAMESAHAHIARLIWEKSDKLHFLEELTRNMRLVLGLSCTPSSKSGKYEMIEFLLEDFDKKFVSSGLVALTEPRCEKAMQLVLDRGATPTEAALIAAAIHGSVKTVELLLDRAIDMNAMVPEDGVIPNAKTALIAAAENSRAAVVALLLRRNANANLQDSTGRTALAAVVSKSIFTQRTEFGDKQIEIMNLLLAAGVDANIRDNRGKTPADSMEELATRSAKAGYPDAYLEDKRGLIGRYQSSAQ